MGNIFSPFMIICGRINVTLHKADNMVLLTTIQYTRMKILANILWLIFGGLNIATMYFFGSLLLAITIVGLPAAKQTLKLGLLCLWPFGSTITQTHVPTGCLRIPLDVAWLLFGGIIICALHVIYGVLLTVTIIGLPFALQHFKMAGLALSPFGKSVTLNV